MSQELKPCPFCSDSSYPENVHPYSLRGYWVVRCSGCESEGPAENTEFDAIAAWNKRAQPAVEAEPVAWLFSDGEVLLDKDPELDSITHPNRRRAMASTSRQMVADSAGEAMTRFCPQCGLIGEVGDKYRDCCPDGSHARIVPLKFAKDCRELFRMAVDGIVTDKAAPAPSASPAALTDRMREILSGNLECLEFCADVVKSMGHDSMAEGLLAVHYAIKTLSAQPAGEAEPLGWYEAERRCEGANLRDLLQFPGPMTHSGRMHWQAEQPKTTNPVWPVYAAPPAAANQAGIPEGWRLVPVEPTREMWDAVNKLDDQMAAGSYDGKGCSIEQAWNCMLAAAPNHTELHALGGGDE